MQLYSVEQIINVELQTENILEKISSFMSFDPKENDVKKTGGIGKQTYFVKNLHGENLKLGRLRFLTCTRSERLVIIYVHTSSIVVSTS